MKYTKTVVVKRGRTDPEPALVKEFAAALRDGRQVTVTYEGFGPMLMYVVEMQDDAGVALRSCTFKLEGTGEAGARRDDEDPGPR